MAEKDKAKTETNLLSAGPVVTLLENDEGLGNSQRQPNQRPTTFPSTEWVLRSLDLFKKDFQSSTTSEKAKIDIVWKALRYIHEHFPIAAITEFMNTVVAKFDESTVVDESSVVVGEKNVLEGQYTRATVFHERVPAFVEGYCCAPKKSKREFLENTVLTLREEGFRFLEKAQCGGYQEMDLDSSCKRVQKRILHILKSRPLTATTSAGSQDATAATTGSPTNMESVLVTPCPPVPFHEPGYTDILPGCPKNHPANLIYRQKLTDILDEFEVALKRERGEIVTRFIEELRTEGYRFVVQSSSQGCWSELDLQRAIQKVRHNLTDMNNRKRKREGLPSAAAAAGKRKREGGRDD